MYVTQTWLFTDGCGHSNLCSQTVTVINTTPPVITCASNKTVTCGAAWSFDAPTATDACSGMNVPVTVVSTVTSGTCPQVFTRTWLAIDAGGNTNTCSQSVTVTEAVHCVAGQTWTAQTNGIPNGGIQSWSS